MEKISPTKIIGQTCFDCKSLIREPKGAYSKNFPDHGDIICYCYHCVNNISMKFPRWITFISITYKGIIFHFCFNGKTKEHKIDTYNILSKELEIDRGAIPYIIYKGADRIKELYPR